MDKRFAVIVVGVVAAIFSIFYFSGNKNSNGGSSTRSTTAVSNHVKGSGKVQLVEYGDFQCPACGKFYPLVTEILNKYGDKISFTFRHNPLDTIHRNARAAHRAAESAGLQGKFFEMYDELYKNQSSWSDVSNPVPVFESYATGLGLNLDKFKTDFASQVVNDTINADLEEGKTKYKVDSTPTFVLNGSVISNSDIGSIDLFSAKIEAAISQTAQ